MNAIGKRPSLPLDFGRDGFFNKAQCPRLPNERPALRSGIFGGMAEIL